MQEYAPYEGYGYRGHDHGNGQYGVEDAFCSNLSVEEQGDTEADQKFQGNYNNDKFRDDIEWIPKIYITKNRCVIIKPDKHLKDGIEKTVGCKTRNQWKKERINDDSNNDDTRGYKEA